MLMYAELSYFDGYAFAHIAAWQDQKRLQRRMAACMELRERGLPLRPLRSCS